MTKQHLRVEKSLLWGKAETILGGTPHNTQALCSWMLKTRALHRLHHKQPTAYRGHPHTSPLRGRSSSMARPQRCIGASGEGRPIRALGWAEPSNEMRNRDVTLEVPTWIGRAMDDEF